VALGAAPAN
jgi:DNA ligase D-like protein (predicted 3'-phosphoesterase)